MFKLLRKLVVWVVTLPLRIVLGWIMSILVVVLVIWLGYTGRLTDIVNTVLPFIKGLN